MSKCISSSRGGRVGLIGGVAKEEEEGDGSEDDDCAEGFTGGGFGFGLEEHPSCTTTLESALIDVESEGEEEASWKAWMAFSSRFFVM